MNRLCGGGFDAHGFLTDEAAAEAAADEALSGVDAREAARRAGDPVNAIDIQAAGEWVGRRGPCAPLLLLLAPGAASALRPQASSSAPPVDAPHPAPPRPAVRETFQRVAAAQPQLMQAASEQLTPTQLAALHKVFGQQQQAA